MKPIYFILALILVTSIAHADHLVRGYVRSNGTYVQPHMQSNADHNPYNNYSAYGNTNPYTGSVGTHQIGGIAPSVPSYQAPSPVYNYNTNSYE